MELKYLSCSLALCIMVTPRVTFSLELGSSGSELKAVAQFYAARNEVPAWTDDKQFEDLINAIQQLSEHGLEPTDYQLSALLSNREVPEKRERLATEAWFSAATHMVYGKLNPLTYEPSWTANRRERDLVSSLNTALTEKAVGSSLLSLAPKPSEYAALTAELAHLRQQEALPVRALPEGPSLKSGMTGPRVRTLQERLVQLGLLKGGAISGVFDEATEEVISSFQDSSNLKSDGVVGPATRRALNRDTRDKITQVMVNLERWRWLPDDLGRRHLRVNIADFSVSAYSEGLRERTHLAIIGRNYRKTPVFSDQIKYVVLNPWWETPRSIARIDKLPLFKRDPGAVERLGFQVLNGNGRSVPPATIDWNSLTASSFPYRIRQAPGPQNALGQIKIMFPNKHNVYLHDTPTRGLFAERQRAFSSGCIRVQDPVDLTVWIFAETPGWDRARFDSMIAIGKEKRVDLQRPVPIHILYFTVVTDSTGTLRYLDDIYNRDGLVLTGLVKPSR